MSNVTNTGGSYNRQMEEASETHRFLMFLINLAGEKSRVIYYNFTDRIVYKNKSDGLFISKDIAHEILSKSYEYKCMLTATQVARLLNIHINTVRRWSDEGALTVYRLGPRRDRRYSPEDVYAYLKSCRK